MHKIIHIWTGNRAERSTVELADFVFAVLCRKQQANYCEIDFVIDLKKPMRVCNNDVLLCIISEH